MSSLKNKYWLDIYKCMYLSSNDKINFIHAREYYIF
jgi:hypothetical protein